MVLLLGLLWHAVLVAGALSDTAQKTLDADPLPPSQRAGSVSTRLFADLERLSRLVDITYCVGNTGVHKPFQCLSRCDDFPELNLVTTWNTGVLLTDSCGYIAIDGGSGCGAPSAGRGAILVAFRGTYSIANTIVDLSTVPQKYIPYPSTGHGDRSPPDGRKPECTNCTVHMGFLQSWQSAREVVLPQLKILKARHPSLPIHLVGHSLGGAVACLAALELQLRLGWDDVVVTTFGEPRVGNHELARFIDDVFELDANSTADPDSLSFRRVTHYDDPVPLLPLDEWGYRAHAGELFISKASLPPTERDMRSCDGDGDPACSTGPSGGTAWDLVISALSRLCRGCAMDHEKAKTLAIPTRLKLWQLFFAHRDYFWRLGLCLPGKLRMDSAASGGPERPGRTTNQELK